MVWNLFPAPSKVYGIPYTFVLDTHVYLIHSVRMKLSEYMAIEGLTDLALAAKVKRDRSNVLRWRKGETRPDFVALLELEKITEGKVTARDFAEVSK